MSKTDVPVPIAASFESFKQNNEHDAEYWSARDLQPLTASGGASSRRSSAP